MSERIDGLCECLSLSVVAHHYATLADEVVWLSDYDPQSSLA
ncbi:MAG TPA: hypothetical protein VKA86_06095 [Candidatus Krumholzibacteria bacterium]|nr:hypothetical protein [Candidatus Krumholzibacteria bacterium]